MAALTGDNNKISLIGGAIKIQGPCNSADTYFNGALLFALNVHHGTPTGLVTCLPTLSAIDVFLGICAKQVTTTAASQPVEYFVGGIWLFPQPTAAVTSVSIGDYLIMLKGGTVTDSCMDLVIGGAAPTATSAIIGQIVGMDASSNLFVNLSLGGTGVAAANSALR